jgi:hypothetical protein
MNSAKSMWMEPSCMNIPGPTIFELESLLSGCICCDLSGAFTEKVGHLLKKTQGAPLFVETTGLADTGQVVAGVEKALVEHADMAGLASVIVMVDAPPIPEARRVLAGGEGSSETSRYSGSQQARSDRRPAGRTCRGAGQIGQSCSAHRQGDSCGCPD